MQTFKSFNEMYESVSNISLDGTTKKVRNTTKQTGGGDFSVLAPSEPVCTAYGGSKAIAKEDGGAYYKALTISSAGKEYAEDIKSVFEAFCSQIGTKIAGVDGGVLYTEEALDDADAESLAEYINQALTKKYWGK